MKSENGITLLALAITVTIMMIISLTVFYNADGIDTEIEDDILIAELETVHHIVLQEYNKKLTLGEYSLIGEPIINSNDATDELGLEQTKLNQGVESGKQISFIRKTTDKNGEERYYKYFKLIPEQLKKIGAKNVTPETKYLVCYETGEVANINEYKTSDGEPLYTK